MISTFRSLRSPQSPLRGIYGPLGRPLSPWGFNRRYNLKWEETMIDLIADYALAIAIVACLAIATVWWMISS
jgi:hypothetical protein